MPKDWNEENEDFKKVLRETRETERGGLKEVEMVELKNGYTLTLKKNGGTSDDFVEASKNFYFFLGAVFLAEDDIKIGACSIKNKDADKSIDITFPANKKQWVKKIIELI